MLNRTTTPPSLGPMAPADAARAGSAVKARFLALVQSPLRAGLLRFLAARPYDTFDVESLMETFGRIRLDITNCLTGLSAGGVVRSVSAHPDLYQFSRPANPELARLLEDFLADRPGESAEDRSPSIQRFRELIGRDEKMMVVFEAIRTVAKTDLAVMVLGPTGSGKEVVARMVHELSSRRNETFQAVNCARFPTRSSSPRSSATNAAPSPARTSGSPAASSSPTTARCSSTKSATCRRWRRPSCCA